MKLSVWKLFSSIANALAKSLSKFHKFYSGKYFELPTFNLSSNSESKLVC